LPTLSLIRGSAIKKRDELKIQKVAETSELEDISQQLAALKDKERAA
jgi:hypothetical protein